MARPTLVVLALAALSLTLAVCAAICLRVEAGIVTAARLAFGGMAGTPKCSPAAEAALTGHALSQATLDAAAKMVHIRETIDPRPDWAGRFREPYVRLVDELARRGWLDAAVAEHAGRRARVE